MWAQVRVRLCMWVLTAAPHPVPPPPPATPFSPCVTACPPLHPLQLAEEEEFEAKRKELEEVASPVFAKLYQQGGGAPGGMPDMGGMPGGGPASGPTVEEGEHSFLSRLLACRLLACLRLSRTACPAMRTNCTTCGSCYIHPPPISVTFDPPQLTLPSPPLPSQSTKPFGVPLGCGPSAGLWRGDAPRRGPGWRRRAVHGGLTPAAAASPAFRTDACFPRTANELPQCCTRCHKHTHCLCSMFPL